MPSRDENRNVFRICGAASIRGHVERRPYGARVYHITSSAALPLSPLDLVSHQIKISNQFLESIYLKHIESAAKLAFAGV